MSAPTLLLGTSYPALRDAAFEWLDDHAGGRPESALFIEANDHRRDAIRTAWGASYDPLRLTVTGLSRFVARTHEGLFGPTPDVGTLERRRMIEEALLELEDTARIEGARRYADPMAEVFRELEGTGVSTTAELDARLESTDLDPATRTAITESFGTYVGLRGELTHPAAEPRNVKFQAVTAAGDAIASARPHLDAVVVSGLLDPTPIETALLDRLAGEYPLLLVAPTPTPDAPTAGVGAGLERTLTAYRSLDPEVVRIEEDPGPLRGAVTRMYRPGEPLGSPPAALSWHEAPTPDREVRHVARRLRARLADPDGPAPEDCLVLAPGLLSYREELADTFAQFGIAHAYRVSILLEQTYAGQAVLDALALCERPRADTLSRLASNPVVTIADVEPAVVAATVRRLSTTAPGALLAELGDAAGLDRILEAASAVRTAEPTALVEAFRALLSAIGVEAAVDALDPDAAIDHRYERRALDRVEATLDSVASVCRAREPDDPLAALAGALEGVRVPAPTRATDGRVEIIGLQDTPMAEFTHLYVVGATAQHLPGRDRRPRFFERIGEALELFPAHRARDRARYRFGTLLANAERAHITTPETTTDDEPLVPSPIVDELARVTGLTPTTGVDAEPRGSPEDLQRALAGGTPDELEGPLADARTNGVFGEGTASLAARGARCAHRRAQDRLTPHDAQLAPEAAARLADDLTATPYSPSRLGTYATCGFKHLLANGYGLETPEPVEPTVDRLTLGTVVHETLEAFYRGLADGDGPVRLAEYDRETLERRLAEAGMDAIEDAGADFDGVFGRRQAAGLFAGLASPAVNDYHGGADGRDADGAFVRFLEHELGRDTSAPTYVEARFGFDGPPPRLPDGRELPVRGIADRIDAGDPARVFDYKTASVAGVRRRERHARDGIDFQLPVYALGAASELEHRHGDRPGRVDAAYYVLNDDPTVAERRPFAERFDELDYGAFLQDTVPDRIDRLAEGFAAGAFQPAVVGASAANCAYCDFRDVCDVRHHRRYGVIEAIDDADHPAYVPPLARPEDTDTDTDLSGVDGNG